MKPSGLLTERESDHESSSAHPRASGIQDSRGSLVPLARETSGERDALSFALRKEMRSDSAQSGR